jgi:hypothetical protein
VQAFATLVCLELIEVRHERPPPGGLRGVIQEMPGDEVRGARRDAVEDAVARVLQRLPAASHARRTRIALNDEGDGSPVAAHRVR